MDAPDLPTQIAKALVFAIFAVYVLKFTSQNRYPLFGEKLTSLAKYLFLALFGLSAFVPIRNFVVTGSFIAAPNGAVVEAKAWGGIDLEDAGLRGKLRFSTPGDVISSMRRWFPEWRVEKVVRGERLPNITKAWPSESVAFYLVWTCWPEATSWSPSADPLLFRGAKHRKWLELNRCATKTLAELGRDMTPEERDKTLGAAVAFLRSRLALALRKATCQESGADDCVLLLLQMAALAPRDKVLADALARIEALLKAVPDKNHPNRQLAIAKVKTVMALGAMTGAAAPSMMANGLHRAEPFAPDVVAALRSMAGISPVEAAMSADEINSALVAGLDAELQIRSSEAEAKNAAASSCCRYGQHAPLWPMGHVEDAPESLRKPAIEMLAAEVVRRAADTSCDPRFQSGLEPEGDLIDNDRYVLMNQLAFLYAATRALSGYAACAATALPPRGRVEAWLVDVPGTVGQLVGNEERPSAHFEGEQMLEGLCAAAASLPGCEKLPQGKLEHALLERAARFQRQSVDLGAADFGGLLPAPAAKALIAVLDGLQCNRGKAELWTSPTSGSLLLSPDCDLNGMRGSAPENAVARPRDDGRSRLLVAYRGGEAYRLLVFNSFMYDDEGTLIDVSDADGDGRLELWFRGTVAECDGDDTDAPCEAEGISYGEDFGGILARFRDKRLEAGSVAVR